MLNTITSAPVHPTVPAEGTICLSWSPEPDFYQNWPWWYQSTNRLMAQPALTFYKPCSDPNNEDDNVDEGDLLIIIGWKKMWKRAVIFLANSLLGTSMIQCCECVLSTINIYRVIKTCDILVYIELISKLQGFSKQVASCMYK